MAATENNSTSQDSVPQSGGTIDSPENLPPVEPPSAGFIIQLFVVPALIVGAVIGVWLLFGRLATNDQDWERQVNELRVDNNNRRFRAAYSLTQMLQADLHADDQSANLKDNKQLATQLVDVLDDNLMVPSQSEEDETLRSYLIRALGWLDVDEVTLPVLIEAMSPEFDLETRQNAITAVSFIAGRDFEAGSPLQNEEITAALVKGTFDEAPEIRRASAFALGLLDNEQVDQRLRVLLEDEDEFVRVNASLALARQKSTAGLDVLEDILKTASKSEAVENVNAADLDASKAANVAEIELILKTKYAVIAVEELAPQLSSSEKERLKPLIKNLADNFREPSIKLSAKEVLKSL
ncbi:MAG: HEAT repeat domain-containing protein [Planctomycetaceae bacterium]|nr:HEAT repeat domain-containing protein [Planctomycetaceae bacterium]